MGGYGQSRNPDGRPYRHGEPKKRVNMSLTKEAVEGLDELAISFGLSRSEFVEQIGREIIPIVGPTDAQSPLDSLVPPSSTAPGRGTSGFPEPN